MASMSNKPAARQQQQPATFSKDLSDFFDKELKRLHDIVKTSDIPPETRQWAMDNIKTIQSAVFAMAAVAVDVQDAVTEAATEVTNGGAAHEVVRNLVSNS